MPFFSILMPTRNRASLLKAALSTAVNQDFHDYEIVVSDNNSADETRAVTEGFAGSCDKIRYVNPGRDLSMCDNWEFVLSHAAGRYLLYLCDDDGLAPNSLSYMHRLLTRSPADVLVWGYGSYGHPDVPDEGVRCTFSYERGPGSLFDVASKPIMDALCAFDASVYPVVPRMLNCAVSQEAVDRCRARTGNFFIPPYPDFSSVGQLLSTNSTYHFVDLPLYIVGVSKISNAGIRYDRKKKIDEYVSLFDHDLLEGVQYPMRYLTTSYFQATWRRFQRAYPETFTSRIDMGAYLNSLFSELLSFEDCDDISEELALLSGYMRDYTGDDSMFERKMGEHRAEARGAAQDAARAGGPLRALRRAARRAIDSDERVRRLVMRARGQAHAESSHSFHKHVPSIADASRILYDHLSARVESSGDLSPIRVTSTRFLNGGAREGAGRA